MCLHSFNYLSFCPSLSLYSMRIFLCLTWLLFVAPSGHPTNVVVTAPTAWDLKVTWYQPHKDERNGDIFRYQVRYTANGTTKFKNSSETKLLLEKADGIRPHTKYNVSVSALTSAGQGPFSPPAPVTTKQHGMLWH